jgi:hypothetical protein
MACAKSQAARREKHSLGVERMRDEIDIVGLVKSLRLQRFTA